MKPRDITELLILAAIWGMSFIFMRILSPVLGPALTANSRLLIAGLLLVAYALLGHWDLQWKKHWKDYLVIGVANSAIPFFFFAYAALHIPAALSAIINSTTPLFGAIFAALFLKDPFTLKKLMGLALGATGVALVVRGGPVTWTFEAYLGVAACFGSAFFYGITSVYIKKYASDAKPMAIAGVSQLFAGAALLPFAAPQLPAVIPQLTGWILLNVFGLTVFCSAIAYLLYYRLVTTIGPSRALTVTFLVPVFGMVWGALLLHEPVTAQMLFGTTLVIVGTTLVLGTKKSKI